MEEVDTRILRFPEVVSKTGLSRSTVYGRVRSGDFPAPVQLGTGRAVGFIEHEVQRWLESLRNRRVATDSSPAHQVLAVGTEVASA